MKILLISNSYIFEIKSKSKPQSQLLNINYKYFYFLLKEKTNYSKNITEINNLYFKFL